MMKLRICLLLLVCMCTAALAQEKKYTIRGKLNPVGVPMKVFLYFRDGDRKFADSTMAKNGKFSFSGTLEHATQASMYIHWMYPDPAKQTGPQGDGTQFMLDAGTTTIEGDRLQTARIDGAEAQKDYEALNKRMDIVRDSVYQIWKVQQGVLPEDSAAAFNRLLYAQRVLGKKASKDFILSHPKSAMSFDLLQGNVLVVEDIPYVEWMMEALKPAFGHTARYQQVAQKIDLAKRFSVGQPAMDFTQSDDKGKMVSLSDVKGKYVLVDFWASWCGPCRTEYPFLKKAYSKYKDRNFEIVGVSIDDKKSLWLDAIKSNGFEWIQLSDLKGRDNAIAKAYGISAIPQNFLIDPQGKIIAKNLRGEDLLDELAKAMP